MVTTTDPIPPTPTDAARRAAVQRLLGVRERDLAALESAHRELAALDADLHRRAVAWFVDHDPEGAHATVGLALLAVGPDPAGRRFVQARVAALPVGAIADVVDYVHGWRVDLLHTRRERKRFRDGMTAAYEAGAGLVRDSLASDGAGATFRGGELLVTLGAYDKVQQVLDYLGLPYATMAYNVVDDAPLRADQVLLVNCPGEFSERGIEAIRRFVAAGGTLVTTDWALKTTVERAFPHTIAHNGVTTPDDVVAVSWVDPESEWTRGVAVEGHALRWWLEGASYPIRVLDPRVRVLVRSDEMGRRFKDDPLVVAFAWGEGMVFHLTSHYYLQRSCGDKAARAQEAPRPATQGGDVAAHLDASSLAAAYSSLRLMANILHDRRRACGV